ncbi:UNVERIFIED_CONTAM: hypothetical protein Sindi_1976500 [Sesamum indicum]
MRIAIPLLRTCWLKNPKKNPIPSHFSGKNPEVNRSPPPPKENTRICSLALHLLAKRPRQPALVEEENLTVASELTAWWKDAHVELLSPTYKRAEIGGERPILDWTISSQSTMLKTHVGQDSWELYKSTILPRDQALFSPMSHIRVEQNFAHSLSQMVADQLLEEEKSKLATREEEKAEHKVQKADLEAQLRELRSKIAATAESAKAEGFSAGRVAGREEYLTLEDFQHELETTRDQVEIKSADYLMEGFDRCTSQIKKLKGFVEGLDTNWIDSTLDGNLAAFPKEPLLKHDDEFLVDEIEKMDEDKK